MITTVTSTLSDAFDFWGGSLIIFSVATIILVMLGCWSFILDIQCKKTKEQIFKDRANGIEERKKHNEKMEKYAQKHRQRIEEDNNKTKNEMLRNGNEKGLLFQALTILNKPNQDITKCVPELGIIQTYYPLRTGLPIETQNQITKYLTYTELQVKNVTQVTE